MITIREPWKITDNDSMQIQRKIRFCNENGAEQMRFYEMYQITELGNKYGEPVFGISHALIDPEELDMKELMDAFSYESEDKFKKEYGSEWEGAAAECEFELESLDCIISERGSWEEARDYLCAVSGYPVLL